MQDLRENTDATNKGWSLPKFNLITFLLINRRFLLKVLLYLLIFIILFFPTQTASIISNWINNFVGTIVHNIKI